MARTVECWVVVYNPERYSATPAICFPFSLCHYFDHANFILTTQKNSLSQSPQN